MGTLGAQLHYTPTLHSRYLLPLMGCQELCCAVGRSVPFLQEPTKTTNGRRVAVALTRAWGGSSRPSHAAAVQADVFMSPLLQLETFLATLILLKFSLPKAYKSEALRGREVIMNVFQPYKK